MEGVTLATVLADIGTVFKSIIGYVGDIAELVVSNKLLLIGFVFPLAMGLITFIRRRFL